MAIFNSVNKGWMGPGITFGACLVHVDIIQVPVTLMDGRDGNDVFINETSCSYVLGVLKHSTSSST